MITPFDYTIYPSFCAPKCPPACDCKHCAGGVDDGSCIDEEYLVLYRGDDTDFNGGVGFSFVIDVPLASMEGYEIEFKFLDKVTYVSNFYKVDEGRFQFSVQFTHEETLKFPYCWQKASITMIQKSKAEGEPDKRRTVSNDVLVHVSGDLQEAYDSSKNAYNITVQPGSIFGALTGITFDLNASLEERMDQIAKIFSRGGAQVIEREPDGE